MGLTLKSLLPLSVLALLKMGLDGLFLLGEGSLKRPSLPWVSDSGMRSLLRLREKVSRSNEVVDELGANMDLGRSLAAGRCAGWP